MSLADRVTVREYDTTEDAKAAETLLLESGLTNDIVYRTGKRIQVIEKWEAEARALLEGATPAYTAYAGTAFAAPEEQGGSATDKVKDTAASAAETARGAASSGADTVQQAASTVTDAAQQAAGAATGQVDRASDAAAQQVQGLADTVRQKGATPTAPAAQRQAAQTTADVLDKSAQYLRQRDVGTMLEDLRGAVRRHPGRSLLIGLGLGYLARGTFFAAPGSQGIGRSSLPGGAETAQSLDYTTAAPGVPATPLETAPYTETVADTFLEGTIVADDVPVVDVEVATGGLADVASPTLGEPATTEVDPTEDPLNPRAGS